MSEIERQIYRGAAYTALETVFGAEWIRLTSPEQRRISDDYEGAATEENCTVREYQRRIGRGNLTWYAACLKS